MKSTTTKVAPATVVEGWPTLQQLMALSEGDAGTISTLTQGGDVESLARMLGSDTAKGITGDDVALRKEVYGTNFVRTKRSLTLMEMVWEQCHDLTMILLFSLGLVSLTIEVIVMAVAPEEDTVTTVGNTTLVKGHTELGWLEPVVLMCIVILIVFIAAGMDYQKQSMFMKLTLRLQAQNKKLIVRGGAQLEVQDSDIVVGDVLLFNAHNLASVPVDGVLIAGADVKIDESALTGEPEPQAKSAEQPVVISGTSVTSGSGKLLVTAVGPHSVSGKIRSAVYREKGRCRPCIDGPSTPPQFSRAERSIVPGQAPSDHVF